MWGDFLTAFIDATQRWSAVFPVGTTWSGGGVAAGAAWADLFQAAAAGRLVAKLKWGAVSGSLTNEADFFQILAPEIEGRYVQVEVTITDPAQDSFLYLKELNMKAAYWQ